MMVHELDQWLKVMDNFNLIVGIMDLVGLLSIVAYTIFLTKIGKKNEYNLQIRLNVTNKMFVTLMVLFIAFIFLVPSGMVHYKQLVYLLFSITALVGAIASGYYFFRDFKS
ncbi:hypothetical protein [Paenibacillus sp. NPDC057967]|uniref:hypothetical protein n=1 Tax=Paenibacillus sp. NPDC057967 TaxID=3346293 RepID=UPI0036DE09B9